MRALIIASLVILASPALADFVLPDGEVGRIYGQSESIGKVIDARLCLYERGIQHGQDVQHHEIMVFTINVGREKLDKAKQCLWPEGSGLRNNR